MKKKRFARLAAVIAAAVMLSSAQLQLMTFAEESDDIVIVYTNDTHCSTPDGFGFPAVSALKAQATSEGKTAFAVDCGDFSQGGLVGAMSKGGDMIEIMNSVGGKGVGYDCAVLGNHEFDFGIGTLITNMGKADFNFLSANFVDVRDDSSIFPQYKIYKVNDKRIAFVGVTTPYTLTSSSPATFNSSDGNRMFDFCQDESGEKLYGIVQGAIDNARQAGADYIVGLAHLGISDGYDKYSSAEVIANTSGFDAVLDGHSHTILESELCTDKDGKSVLLSSTGSHFENIGRLTISDGEFSTELINAEKFAAMELSDEAKAAYDETAEVVAQKLESLTALTNTVIGHSDYNLTVNDPESGLRLVRSGETNAGDFCADAYRAATGADVSIINGGGVRAELNAGDVTLADLININPFGNMLCVYEVTGQQLLDALELGASAYPEESGGFLQVSGMSYEIYEDIPSSVVLGDDGMFISVSGEYRVKNVCIDGEPLDTGKTYTVAGISYILKEKGDGYAMFGDSRLILDEICVDSEALNRYITEDLGGNIGEGYKNPYGDGRITFVKGEYAPTDVTKTDSVPTGNTPAAVYLCVSLLGAAALYAASRKKH